MADGQEHKQRTHSTGESEDVVGEQLDAASARKAEIDADVDSILMRSTTSRGERRGVRGQFRAEGRPVTHASGLPAHFMRPAHRSSIP